MKINSFALVFASCVGLSCGRLNTVNSGRSEQENVIDHGEYDLASKNSTKIKEKLRGLAGSYCGGGYVGSGVCADPALCCSEWGWCGTSRAHCGNDPPASASCGNGAIGNGVCANPSLCCSAHGWCGTSAAHCNNSPPQTTAAPPITTTSIATTTTTTTPATTTTTTTPATTTTTTTPATTTTTTTPPTTTSTIATGRGTCGGGNRGNGACANPSHCCSIYGWCGTSAAHCNNSPVPNPSPSPPSSPQPAYLTYHMYFENQPLTQVSCSDGLNGLMTKWGYSTIQPMWPYVAATSNLQWNSPVCGTCYAVSSEATGKTIYITTIDKVAHPGPNNELHFDLSWPAFYELLGDAGYQAGSAFAKFQVVDASYCRGNLG